MALQTVEKVIRIDVVQSANAQRAIKAMAADMQKVEGHADRMRKSMDTGFQTIGTAIGRIQNVLGALGIAATMGAITRYTLDAASAYTVLEQRLKLVLGTQEQAALATKTVFEIAKASGKEIDGVAKLYEKAARSGQQFGLTQQQVTQVTQGFAQSIRLSGSSTQEAYAALVQFGQALASGRLQGDEFRSLMENNSVFMFEFAKAAGVSVSALRRMGTEGKLNAEFLFDTMLKKGADGLNMLERLNKMAESVPLTFRQSLSSASSATQEFIGEISKFVLEGSSSDKQGIFGPLIRSLSELTSKIKEMKIESDALGEGFFTRLLSLLGIAGNAVPTITGPGQAGVAIGTWIANKLGVKTTGGDEPLAVRIDNDVKRTQEALARAQKNLAGSIAFRDELGLKSGSQTDAFATLTKNIANQREEVKRLNDDLLRLKSTQQNLQYGERADPAFGQKKPKPEPTAEELRKAKAATESLADYIRSLGEEARALEAVYEGREEYLVQAKKMEAFETKLKEANASGNSTYATQGRLLLAQIERFRQLIDLRTIYRRELEKEGDATRSQIQRVQDQIDRDNAAIEALREKTKATQEYTTAALEREREEALAKLRSFLGNANRTPSAETTALREQLEALIKKYDEAIAKRAELEGEQAVTKQLKEQKDVDDANRKRIDKLADQINDSLKESIANGNVGQNLFDNLKKTLKNKAIDIVINPVTTLLSQTLARIADTFGSMITRTLMESLSNSSFDPLGTFIGFLTGGGFPLAGGIRYVPHDNFPAVLHRGERVLTAKENRSDSAAGGSRTQPVMYVTHAPVFQIDSRADIASVKQIAMEESARSNRALVEDLQSRGLIPS